MLKNLSSQDVFGCNGWVSHKLYDVVVMSVSDLQLDFGLTGLALTASLPPVSTLWHKRNFIFLQELHDNGGFEPPGHRAATVWCGKSQAPSEEERKNLEGRQEFLWRKFFSDPAQWWDNRLSKKTPRHPDFRHKQSNDSLFLNNWYKPAWVEAQLAIWDAGMKRPPAFVATVVQEKTGSNEDGLEVEACSRLCEFGPVTEAVDALTVLVKQGSHIPHNLFYRVLKRCIAQKNLVQGRRVHALSVTSGYESNPFLANHLICMYASHRSLVDAMQVFSKVSAPDAHMWSSIILACARHGQPTQAIQLYRQLCESTIKPDNHIFVAVLKACASARDLAAGKYVHAHILASADKPDMFVQNSLVNMYAKCGSLKDARRVFDRLSQKNMVTWTAMIAGYAKQGMGQEALDLYSCLQRVDSMPPDSVTLLCLLQACAVVGEAGLHKGKQLHAQIVQLGVQADVVIGASLVNMYAKCGSLEDAQIVFDSLSQKDVVTWTAMIAGYAKQGMGQEALSLYNNMQQEGITPPDAVTFVCLLQACARVGAAGLQQGKQLHVQIEERGLKADLVLGNNLVNMYVKCKSLVDAQTVFDRLPRKDVVSWTAMIAGYAQQGMGQEALRVYSGMQQEGISDPSYVTFACLLQACAGVGAAALDQGKQLHTQIEERGLQDIVVVGNSLINMYAKCGSLEDARGVFENLPHKDVVAWTAMIAGYAQQDMGQEALTLYSKMQQEGITLPDAVTFASLLQACGSVAALPLGKQLHAQIEEQGLQADLVVGNSLVNMYAKCGSMVDAQQVFDSLPEKTIVAWGALIAGYTRQGDSKLVFDLVDRMTNEGVEPNGITFLSVLTVCSHVGLVDKGRKYFEAMSIDYSISPTIEHYTCMVDLLGRAGQLDEALVVVKTMPFKPDATVWLTLLGACQKWKNVEVGRQAFEFAVRLDEKESAAYALMSNIYADSDMWEEAQEMQAMRKKLGAWKQPGQSWWTDEDGFVHSFEVGDKKHAAVIQMKEDGCVALLDL